MNYLEKMKRMYLVLWKIYWIKKVKTSLCDYSSVSECCLLISWAKKEKKKKSWLVFLHWCMYLLEWHRMLEWILIRDLCFYVLSVHVWVFSWHSDVLTQTKTCTLGWWANWNSKLSFVCGPVMDLRPGCPPPLAQTSTGHTYIMPGLWPWSWQRHVKNLLQTWWLKVKVPC